MIKNLVRLESVVENKVGHFLLENDCPIELAEQMLMEFIQYLGQVKAQAKAAQQTAVPDTPEEPPKPEVSNV